MNDNRVLVVGIDPGATAGVVCLEVDADRPSDIPAWRWVDHLVLKHKTQKGASDVEIRTGTGLRLASWLTGLWANDPHHVGIDAVVLERPADISGGWKGSDDGRGGRMQGTKTAFGLGESYGVLAMACRFPESRVRRLYDYEVRTWMPKARTGNFKHTQKREDTLMQLGLLARSIRGQTPAAAMSSTDKLSAALDENVLMALGVLRFHLCQ